MIERKAILISGLLILGFTLAGLAAWALLPVDQPVSTHFDADGVPDGWMPPARAFLSGPALGAVMWGFFLALRWIGGPQLSTKARAAVFYTPVVVVAAMQVYFISAAFGLSWLSPRIILVAIGLTWMMMGNVMGKLRPNNVFGVRTPWTLADPHIWDQANRFGGWGMVLAGLGTILLAVTMDPGWPMMWSILALPFVAMTVAWVRSWLLWRRRHPGERVATSRESVLRWTVTTLFITALGADLAFERGASSMPLSVGFLLAMLVCRYVGQRRQRH